ncbi:LysR family transcriptional regulator [Shinella sp. WSJ-2]|uniref:LysR family transcriptional regulator n=1 Tax=Shinella sp. WSJ-2 TaxID=2303749 RepID=UPI000E3E8812|nr:LysR family transcriptional regulator [Shinella sp. WSJ-2]MBO9629565.1 LysR family transcriptional regulator [Shinella sp.]RFZ81170.1 LysR family transcriptional regulator [Shinella sp. WSJ-2]
MLDLDSYLLRAFLTVAEIGTVSGAAATLNRTQAAVSMQLRKLEELVGVRLFLRSSKGLSLTAQGQIMLPYAREIVTLADEVGKRLSGKTIRDRVRLGVVEDFAAGYLIEILRNFRDQNPDIEIDIIIEPNRRLATLFNDGLLDLTVCDISCLSRKPTLVWTEYMMWTVRSDFVVDATKPLPIIMFDEGCPWTIPVTGALSQRNIAWKTACVASTLVAVATAVRVGIGIAPMIANTQPDGCRTLDKSSDLPAPVRIEIGLYSQPEIAEGARYLVEFIARHAAMLPA